MTDGFEEFKKLNANVGPIELSMVEADFIRYAILTFGDQEEEALSTDEPTVAGMIADLSERLLDLFSPVAWAQYHTVIRMDDDD